MKTSILIAALVLSLVFSAKAQEESMSEPATGYLAASQYINAGKTEFKQKRKQKKEKKKLAQKSKKKRDIANEKSKPKKKKKKTKKHA